MILIVDHVTAKDEEGGKDAVVKAAKLIEEDIKELMRCAPHELWSRMKLLMIYYSTLGTINRDLREINVQNRWVIAFYKELNMGMLEDCMNRLSTALERFKVCLLLYYHDQGSGS